MAAQSPIPESTEPSALTAFALAAASGVGTLISPEGEIITARENSIDDAIRGPGLLVCHGPFLSKRLGLRRPLMRQPGLFDLAELYVFAQPSIFAPPTVQGIATALGSHVPPTENNEPTLLFSLRDRLIARIAAAETAKRGRLAAAALHLKRGGWSWSHAVLDALALSANEIEAAARFEPWRTIEDWEDPPPRPQPGAHMLQEGEASAALGRVLEQALGVTARETRAAQRDYAETAAAIFRPRQAENMPHIVAAEAGTGIGKTLGYLAPALLWSERNDGLVWISTFTKNLQRQIAQTLAALIPDTEERRRKIVISKGRENYLCLLNFEEAFRGGIDPVGMGLIGRWVEETADGDMIGGDFPAWLVPLIAQRRSDGAAAIQRLGLTDRRGECIFGACAHYRRCFIESSARRAEGATLVIANHAKVFARAAGGAFHDSSAESAAPTRLIFDEGQTLFDAADGSFAAHITALEMADLRRWLRGSEGRRRAARGRTIFDRLGDLIGTDDGAREALERAMQTAGGLAGYDWADRLRDGGALPDGLAFLAAIRSEVLARAETGKSGSFGLEADCRPAGDSLLAAASRLEKRLGALRSGLGAVRAVLLERLKGDARPSDLMEISRIEGALRSLTIRTDGLLPAWQDMLRDLAGPPRSEFIDWIAIERSEGREQDLGLYRHHLDPTVPLERLVYRQAHGVLITSATLFDRAEERGDGAAAGAPVREHLGLKHLAAPPLIRTIASPFDYPNVTRVIVARDVDTRETEQLAVAIRMLIEAAGGGTLALFSAIERLRAVHARIAAPLERKGLPLYAQHVDDMDTGTLIDIFRSETDASLLGTDAVRDGVDVPGRSLRLIIMERVPWPRPDMLHKARRAALGGRAFEEEIVRERIVQAYGRLIRREGDRGVFVLLGAQSPSRIFGRLPEGVEIIRTGLADAARLTHGFLSER